MHSSDCYAIQALREMKPERSLAPVEKARDHSTTNVSCQRRRVEARLKHAACLAKLVTSRESESVRDGKGKSNSCDPVSAHSSRHLTTRNGQHTDQRQPKEMDSDNRDNGQSHPKTWLRVQCEPKETLVGRSDHFSTRLIGLRSALKHPMRIAAGGIDFVPPS